MKNGAQFSLVPTVWTVYWWLAPRTFFRRNSPSFLIFLMSRRPDSRDTILAAAEAVVLKAGAAHLTLDAVAEAAGISKGGLLHRFPSKGALLGAMVARQIARCEDVICATRDTLPDTPGKELRAYVLGALRDAADTKRICSALLAAAANQPKLLAPVRENFRRRLEALAETTTGGKLERAAVVCLAADGLWLMELLGLSPFKPTERERIIAELLRLAEAHASKPPVRRRRKPLPLPTRAATAARPRKTALSAALA